MQTLICVSPCLIFRVQPLVGWRPSWWWSVWDDWGHVTDCRLMKNSLVSSAECLKSFLTLRSCKSVLDGTLSLPSLDLLRPGLIHVQSQETPLQSAPELCSRDQFVSTRHRSDRQLRWHQNIHWSTITSTYIPSSCRSVVYNQQKHLSL